MGESKQQAPQYHVLHFLRDQDDGCALTVRTHDVRFHITVDRDDLRDRSEKGKKITHAYTSLLRRVKESEENVDASGRPIDGKDEDNSETADSGVELEYEPTQKLYEWIMDPMSVHLQTKANDTETRKERSVQDWYHGPLFFYYLAIEDGQLVAQEDPCSASLEKRIEKLVPNLALPKYIRDLDIPAYNAVDVMVVSESDEQTPIRPALVEVEDASYFLKVIDIDQTQPTKREIRIMKEIEAKGLHKDLRMPLVRGLVHFDGARGMMGFLMDTIPDPKPLTLLLDPAVPQEKRTRWAEESRRMVDLLHANNIVWGDAKGDNFLVDTHDDLWIIDFGGMYTPGWIDPELNETEAGDEMGMRKIENALRDPETYTMEPGEEEVEDEAQLEKKRDDEPDRQTEKRSSKRKHESTEAEPQAESESREPSLKHRRVSSERGADDRSQEQAERYCVCGGEEEGRMIACDSSECAKKWFHFSCVGIREAPSATQWYCNPCKDWLWDEFGHGKGQLRSVPA